MDEARRWIKKLLEEKLAQQRRVAMGRLRPLIEKRRRGEGLTRADVEEAMGATCWGSLAYCCSPEKECGYRDAVLEALGLTKRDYARYKGECKRLLWRVLKRKKVIRVPP